MDLYGVFPWGLAFLTECSSLGVPSVWFVCIWNVPQRPVCLRCGPLGVARACNRWGLKLEKWLSSYELLLLWGRTRVWFPAATLGGSQCLSLQLQGIWSPLLNCVDIALTPLSPHQNKNNIKINGEVWPMGGLPNIRGSPLKGTLSFLSLLTPTMLSGFTPVFSHLQPHQRSKSNLWSILGWNLPVWVPD